ncbi:long-chain-fatty-acid--CoA ligase [Endozoicomonas atrinae]|uniref:long-chain-fatty-acid--CoA ligase n=1 Tax=Endozoicomonas atrinae TaxID=1333660 RepID=UPI000826207A|nr:long-chain-fatty-acid--CoA ligase [Endozoicomonas atrinae]
MFSLTQLIRRSAQINPNGIATSMNGRVSTWSQLLSQVAGLAGGFRQLGIKAGDRVAILALNSDRYYQSMFAIPWAGAVNVPINCRLADPEIQFWLEDCQAGTLLVDRSFADRIATLKPKLPALKQVIYMDDGEPPHDFISFDPLLSSTPASDAGRANDDLAAIYYTGGTTGRSKGVMLSHQNLVSNTLQAGNFIKVSDNERILHVAPMFHIADGVMINSCAMVAGSNYFLPSFEPVAFMKMVEEHKIQRMLVVPTMINMIVNHPEVASYDLSSLTDIVYGASPMPEAVIVKAMEVLPHTRFYQGYGQTETSPFISGLAPEYHTITGPLSGRLSSAGRAIPGVELAILDENDEPVSSGNIGEICLKGPNVMLGYLGLPDVTEKTLKNGWLHTGDSGRIDEDGFVYIVDRVKDMIVSGGENVYSIEVENAIHKHPSVAQCAVIGIPSDKWGEQVHAIIVPTPGATTDETVIMEHCRTLIADYKCPRSISIQDSPLPLSGAGKILKNELRRPYWDKKARSIN